MFSWIGGIADILARIWHEPQHVIVDESSEERRITPADVENLIDAIGRDRVFARARELGWIAPDSPPLWVWYQICCDLFPTAPKVLGNHPLH